MSSCCLYLWTRNIRKVSIMTQSPAKVPMMPLSILALNYKSSPPVFSFFLACLCIATMNTIMRIPVKAVEIILVQSKRLSFAMFLLSKAWMMNTKILGMGMKTKEKIAKWSSGSLRIEIIKRMPNAEKPITSIIPRALRLLILLKISLSKKSLLECWSFLSLRY